MLYKVPTPLERYQNWIAILSEARTDHQMYIYGSWGNRFTGDCAEDLSRERVAFLEGEKEYLTDAEIKEMALKFMKTEEDNLADDKSRVNHFLKKYSPEQVKTQMITLSIDQKLDPAKAVAIQFEVIEKIKKANYKCFSNVSHKFEYYTKTGFNPHIHIVLDKNKSDGQISQLIRRKLKDNPEVYRVHVSTLHYQAHHDYIQGKKTEEKHEFLEKDEVFREIHQIQDIYNW